MARQRGRLPTATESVLYHICWLILSEAVRGVPNYHAQSLFVVAGFRECLNSYHRDQGHLRRVLPSTNLLAYRAMLTRICQIITMDEKHMQFILATGYDHFSRGVRQKERM